MRLLVGFKIHARRSAKMLKRFGADCRPNGSQVLMESCLFQCMTRRGRSPGCTGRRQKALFMLILAKNVPGPSVSMWLIAVSTVIYVRLQNVLVFHH